MDTCLCLPNRSLNSQLEACCSWCDKVKSIITRYPEQYLRFGCIFNFHKGDISYVCKVLRLLLPRFLTVNQKWDFDSTIETYYLALSRRRLVLLIRLLEIIALNRQRVHSRQKFLFLLGLSEMIDVDNQNALDNRNAQLRPKFSPIQARQRQIPKDFHAEFKQNAHHIDILMKEVEFERFQHSCILSSLNRELLAIHQKTWNGLSGHFDCFIELCEAMSGPLITIEEIKTFLCCLLDCDKSNEVVQDICFEYERQLPMYQPWTLKELSLYAAQQIFREAGTLPHGVQQLCIPNCLKCLLIK